MLYCSFRKSNKRNSSHLHLFALIVQLSEFIYISSKERWLLLVRIIIKFVFSTFLFLVSNFWKLMNRCFLFRCGLFFRFYQKWCECVLFVLRSHFNKSCHISVQINMVLITHLFMFRWYRQTSERYLWAILLVKNIIRKIYNSISD